MFADMLIERNLIRPRFTPPPSLAIPDLIHDDAENPGAQTGLRAESMQSPKDAEKHLLRNIEGLFTIAQEMGGKPQDHPMVLEDQRGVGRFIAGEAAFNQRRLSGGDL
jgi:hypothetical protein